MTAAPIPAHARSTVPPERGVADGGDQRGKDRHERHGAPDPQATVCGAIRYRRCGPAGHRGTDERPKATSGSDAHSTSIGVAPTLLSSLMRVCAMPMTITDDVRRTEA
jgi:hypothetical protein